MLRGPARGSTEPIGFRPPHDDPRDFLPTIADNIAGTTKRSSDYVLQLDIVDGLIQFRVWKPEEPMPDEPQLHVRDNTWRVGYSGIYSANPSPEVPAVVRFFEFSDTPIRDPIFRRGDCNDDGKVDIADPVCILNWLFAGATPGCLAATNTNGDDAANIVDATYLLTHLFLGGPAPSQPFPGCALGKLEADAKLGCETSRCQ